MKSTCKKHKDFLIAIALALVIVVLTGLVLDCSHDWGDDFAAYLLEGVALSNGTYQEQISLNYALHNRLDPKLDYGKTHIYVWGYPLLLSLVCNIVGYDTVTYSSLVYYKIPGLIFLGLFAFVFYLLLRKRFSIPISILQVLLFSTCTQVTEYTNSTMTEIVFLAMCFISFYISEKLLEQENPRGRILYGILLGVSLWFTYEVRLNGIMVLLCILLQQLLNRFVYQKRKFSKEDFLLVLPYAVFGLLYLVFNIFVFGKATSQTSDLTDGSLSVFLGNVKTYYLCVYDWLHDTLLHLHGGSDPFSRKLITVFVLIVFMLFFVGLIFEGFRKKNLYLSAFLIASFIGTCMLSYTQWIRYVFMLLPLFIMFAVYGVLAFISFIKKCVNHKKIHASKHTKIGGIISAILCICLSLYSIFPLISKDISRGANWNAYGYGAFSDDSRKAYAYIQSSLPFDCVIQCDQYRALLLNTNRLTIHTSGDSNIADYYMHLSHCAYAAGFSTDDFSEIFHTDSVQLYKRINK